jgi:CDP-diacylglycerol--glycerol-3-phosphate 3-phosphatidyltransferase
MTLPNALTLFRIALIPVFWILEVQSSPAAHWAALFVFILAAVTDFFDGQIARRKKLVTSFGKIMDPLADKLLIIAALMLFTQQGDVPFAALMIIVSRELAVTSLRVVAMGEGKVLAADMSGKAKTFSQCIYCIIMLLHIENFSFIPQPELIKTILIWFVTAITLYSGIDYFYKNRSMIRLTADK